MNEMLVGAVLAHADANAHHDGVWAVIADTYDAYYIGRIIGDATNLGVALTRVYSQALGEMDNDTWSKII